MKYNLFKISLLIFAGVLPFTACETFKNSLKKQDSQTVKKEAVLPQDRGLLQVEQDPKTYSPEEFAKGIIKGDWAIDEVDGRDAVGEVAPFLKFSQGKIYGNNGCNTINGEYTYSQKDSVLKFSNVAVTMMLCNKEGITDNLINFALNETRHYSLKESADGYILNFYDAKGKKVMQLTHQNLDFLNGTWKVIAIDGESVNIEKMKLVFDIDEHKIHGNTGCNVLNGRLETDMDTPNTFSFEAIAVTMMMCPEIEYQTAMLVALEDACRAKPINKNQVILLNANGDQVLTLERTSDK